eukprot:m.11256 g.11256  ORF g.11256 m.11256 type:complete len:288 (+) comp4414_c0_seq1:64-927(+)
MASGIPLLVAALFAHSGDGSPPPSELHPSVDAAAISPNTALGTQWVKALGEAGDVGACSALCSGWRNATDPAAACLSFTLYNSSAPPALQGRCYGRVTPLWIPHRSTSATSGRLLIPCRSNLDCSLNGACGSDGRCNCSAGWKGLRCGELNLGPVNPRALGFKDPIRSSNSANTSKKGKKGSTTPTCVTTSTSSNKKGKKGSSSRGSSVNSSARSGGRSSFSLFGTRTTASTSAGTSWSPASSSAIIATVAVVGILTVLLVSAVMIRRCNRREKTDALEEEYFEEDL